MRRAASCGSCGLKNCRRLSRLSLQGLSLHGCRRGPGLRCACRRADPARRAASSAAAAPLTTCPSASPSAVLSAPPLEGEREAAQLRPPMQLARVSSHEGGAPLLVRSSHVHGRQTQAGGEAVVGAAFVLVHDLEVDELQRDVVHDVVRQLLEVSGAACWQGLGRRVSGGQLGRRILAVAHRLRRLLRVRHHPQRDALEANRHRLTLERLPRYYDADLGDLTRTHTKREAQRPQCVWPYRDALSHALPRPR